jgi:hexosaminidase
MPASIQLDTSRVFRVDTSTTVYIAETADSATFAVAQYLRSMLTPIVGHEVRRGVATGAMGGKRIELSIDPAIANPEGYRLDVTPDDISIVAQTAAGLFYGIQTLRQLMPVSVEYQAAVARRLTVPTGHIVDAPRYEWRGMHIDVARHFLPPRDVKRFIDVLSLYKINRLHLHLADDQGWRIEILSRPNLAKIGGLTQVGGGVGGYFTQDEYKDIVAYAASRFITVVPEIDMPAHLNAAMVSYPELTCDGVAPPAYTFIGAPKTVLCVDSARVYPVIEDIVREISAMTPGAYYHIGGDEVPRLTKTQYLTFIERMQSIVSANGKRMIGWADIAPANLTTSTIMQHWSTDSVQIHVRRGGKVIMSPGPKAYLDMKYDSTTILGLKWAGFISPQVSYDWDPATYRAGVPDSAILGVEAPLWSETVVRPEDFEFMAFPRVIAFAEIGWTPQSLRSWNDFNTRLQIGRKRLTALGVNAGY